MIKKPSFSNKDVPFHILITVLNLFVIGLFWIGGYNDFINMSNNGYINKDSITFKINTMNNPFEEEVGDFLLFQYKSSSPNLKYVWVNGNPRLPSLDNVMTTNIKHSDTNLAIIGKGMNTTSIPSEYQLYGYFASSNSYKLYYETWLINHQNPEWSSDSIFVFSSPSINKSAVFSKFINDNTIEIIHSEYYGTYTLKSNQTFSIVSWIIICLFTALSITLIIIKTKKDKNFITILYISGLSLKRILYIELKMKTAPQLYIWIVLILSSILFQQYIFPLWNDTWILYSLIYFIISIFTLFLIIFYTVNYYIVGKGGSKF